MVVRKSEGALSDEERRMVKALLSEGWRNQDIQALLNVGRVATVNSARITEVKGNSRIKPASADEVAFFLARKKSYDPKTGLNLYEDERLIRSREAMLLAVHAFNNPSIFFKTEVFAVLANIAWTYLLHEYYLRRGIGVVDENGNSLLLSQMLKREDCPLSDGVKRNLGAMKEIRDAVEHLLLRKSDVRWFPLYQACCLNYDNALCELFGVGLSLKENLSVALQFAKMSMEGLAQVQKFDVPAQIEALDARINGNLSDEEKSDIEYQFRVVYTIDSASKSRAHMHFVHPGSEQAEHVRNVLVKYELADASYPFKPGAVVKKVSAVCEKKFTSHNHTQAWRFFKVRPLSKAKQPQNTKKDYCIYHPAHKDYTYSEDWIKFLIAQWSDEKIAKQILSVKV